MIFYPFWFLHILQRILFNTYLWQLKEYRIDRFLEEARRSKKIILPASSLLALLLFAVLELNLLGSYFIYLLTAFYFLLGLRSLWLFYKKRWRFPVFTKKMLILSAVIFLVLGFLFLSFGSAEFVLIFEIAFPLFIFICLSLIQIPTAMAKYYVFWRAGQKRKSFKDLIVIGITGSFGKSFTKDFLAYLLSFKFKVLKTEGNTNTEIGVANTILKRLKKEHQIFVCEMAAYKKGEIRRSSKMAIPRFGILTGINQQHLSLFGSQKNIIEAKFELLEALPESGTIALNWDNEFIKSQNLKPRRIIRYSIKEKADIWTEAINEEKKSLFFRVLTRDGESADFKMNLAGRYNISNILGAIAIAKGLGMGLSEISRLSSGFVSESGALLKKGYKGLNVLDASYSANPNSVIAHLEYLKQWNGKKIIVMSNLIELGSSSPEVYGNIGKKVTEVCDLTIFTNKESFKEIEKEVPKALLIENAEKIFEGILNFAGEGSFEETIVLLEGRVPGKLINLILK